MSENTQIDELRREIRADRLIVLRCWMVYLTWACTFWVPEYRSIFNSMNIELPLATKALLGISGLLVDWWFFMLPGLWITWRMFEDRWLLRQSHGTLRLASFIALAIAFFGNQALTQPLLKLINNVG